MKSLRKASYVKKAGADKTENITKNYNITNMRERIVRAVAGTMVLISITLAYFVSIYWLGLTAFVGLNLLQSSITHFCPLEKILDKAGVESGNGQRC